MGISEQLESIASQYIALASSQYIAVPLIFGWMCGFMTSLSVKHMKRKSDREKYCYAGNMVGASLAFLLINLDSIQTAMSALIFVAGSSVIIPMIFFRWYNK